MCAASTSSSGSSSSPASTAASKGVCGSMVSGYTLTCVAPRRTMRSVRLSGFASIVHSTSSVRCIDSDSVYSSIDRPASPTWLGVPPPRYTVSTAPSSPSLALRRI